jgi:type I restriction enzyme S subunit
MSFPVYPEYASTGNESTRVLPKHWSFPRLKAVAAQPIVNGVGEAGAHENLDWPRYIRITDIEGPRRLREDTFASLPPEVAESATVEVGDLLLAAVGASYGKSYLHTKYRGPACFAGFLVRLSPGPALMPEFASYWTESAAYWVQVRAGVVQATIQNFSAGKYRELRIPCPPLEEQARIIGFLDTETAKLDALVAEQQRLIALLREKRQAVISEVVLRGIRPRRALIHSGVDWIGNIPSDWKIVSFLRCVHIAEGQVDPEDAEYSELPLIAPNHIESRTGRLLEVETAGEQGAISGKYLCRSGAVIYSKIRPALRKAVIAPFDCLCSADMYPLTPRDFMTADYLHLLLLSDSFSALALLESERVAMPKINRETLNGVRLPVPPRGEQEEIVQTIREETGRIDGLLFEVERAIALLQERRAALISAAVTGQIDVRTYRPAEELVPA